jgi:signal transduction histidine kinase
MSTGLWEPLRARATRLSPAKLDAIFAVAMIGEIQLESWLGGGVPGSDRPVTAVAGGLLAGLLAIRRRAPGPALVLAALIATVQTPLGGQLLWGLGGSLVVLVVLGYGAGAWMPRRAGRVTLAAAVALLGITTFLPHGGPDSVGGMLLSVLLLSVMVAPGWAAGRIAGERSRRAAAFRELAEQAAAEQEHSQSTAISDERARIGSELHDIIAHSVTSMVVQAGGARLALSSDPDQARASILQVEQTGREALADLRRMLGMLRRDGDPQALMPQPGLAQLGKLLERMRAAGLQCELLSEGEPLELTPGVDLVGYRIAETLLLSGARHRSRRAHVTIRYLEHEIELEIRGDRPIPDIEAELEPIVRRVALYDGSMRTLPARAGEFAIQARLPVAEAVPA